MVDVGKVLLEKAIELAIEKGAVSAITSKPSQLVLQRIQQVTATAQLRALENLETFVHQVAVRLTKYRERKTGIDPLELLGDPDVAHAYSEASKSAARTPVGERHRLLADLVVARFSQSTDSLKAIAANDAIAVAPRLSAMQLQALGVLAVVHYIRPAENGERAELDRARREDIKRADRIEYGEINGAIEKEVNRYADWILSQLSEYESTVLGHTDVAHLASAGCVLLERDTIRELPAALARSMPNGDKWVSYRDTTALATTIRGSKWKWLTECWEGLLEHCLPTPSGLLLGCAVHDVRHDGAMEKWEWGSVEVHDLSRKTLWDGSREIDATFLKKLVPKIEDELRRRAAQW